MAWRRVVPSADPLSLSLTSSSAADTAAGSGGAAGFRPCRESKIPHLEEQARATKTRAATHPETARPLLIGAASGFAISGMIQRSQMSDEAGPAGSRVRKSPRGGGSRKTWFARAGVLLHRDNYSLHYRETLILLTRAGGLESLSEGRGERRREGGRPCRSSSLHSSC